MQPRRFARVRRPISGRAATSIFKVLNRNVVWVVLLIVFLIFSSQMYFHSKMFVNQDRERDCKWLSNPPLVCAHGGDSSKAPPNTEASYRIALDLQVDCIEIDASRTQDGVLVALHDRDLQAISNNEYMHVGDLNFSQIKELRPGARFSENFHEQHIPTLESALQYVMPHVNQVIIDAKEGPPKYDEGMAIDIFSVMKTVDCRNCVLWAKSDKIVEDFTHLSSNPESLGFIVMKDKVTGKVTSPLRMKGAGLIGAFHGIVTRKLVNTAHRAGKKLHAWTVDEESAMIHMLKTGVDGIVTSIPNLLQRVMGSERQHCAQYGFS
ncbi:hypothetical protein M758_1G235000 [Ceratodon purpureus]|uniref:glycerophosphodiester phosphodiesterase n=1 Tax=Ceratodon purpureus TaxID=3225 RepID=A0A8T0JAJ8_CERPU|nr:hypothetical protein KC19_1G240100 [Ceratodon purpureus]KAG0631202.1 hypothetical protein M758_1G235000 [Ceratodon purpureus]